MPNEYGSQTTQGRNLCPSCKASSTLEVDGEQVDATIEDDYAWVFDYEMDEGDVLVCRRCETSFPEAQNPL